MKNEYKPKGEKRAVKPEENLLNIGRSKGYITISKDQGRITYNATGKSYSFADPEETIRAQVYTELVEKYKYPADRIDTEIEAPRREPKLPADIVVYEKTRNKCFIVVEAKWEETEKKIEEAKREGLGNATLLDAQYLLLACGSLRLAYDVYEKPPPEELEEHRIADIPIAYGKEPQFKYKKGDAEWDLKATNFNELQQKFQLCHDEIWEGGKRDPAIAFDEMSKLMFTKIFDERSTKNGEYYRFQIGTHEDQRNAARRIREIYAKVQDKEPDVFKGEIELPDRLVFRLVEILQDLSFSRTDLDIKGRAFEKFLDRVFRGEFGQYFTRREIVEFMVDMLEPTKDDMCLDPACGSGGFLLYAMDRVRKKAEVDYAGDKRTIEEIFWNFPRDSIFGIEINDRIARIAMMDMVIHEDGHTNIENNDSLGDPTLFNPKRDIKLGKYTFLLTNPPFGAKVKDEEVLKQYELGSKQKKRKSQRTEILFIERCLDFLRPSGRMGFVLPDGILTNSSLQYVRDFIERKAKILAVISLPQTAFVPVGAGVKASLLFLQKKRFDGEEIGNYPVFMSIAKHIGYDATSRPDKNELPEILGEYKEFLQGKREFNPAFVVYKQQLEGRIDPYYYQPHFLETLEFLTHCEWEQRRLIDCVKISNDTCDPRRSPEASFSYIEISDVDIRQGKITSYSTIPREKAPSRARMVLREGDIILSTTRPYRGAIAIVPEGLHKSIGSTGFAILRTTEINRLFLHALLRTDFVLSQLERNMTGSNYPAITAQDLANIKIPLPPHEIQREIANTMEEAYKEQREKLAKAKELLDSIEPYLLEQLGIRVPQMKQSRSFATRLESVKRGRFDPFHYRSIYTDFVESLKTGSYPTQNLGDLIELITSGQRPKGGVRHIEEGMPSLGGEHITADGGFNFSEVKYVPKEFFDGMSYAHLQPPDVLLVKDGATTGKVAIIEESFPYKEACINEHVFRIVPKEEVDPYYLFAFLYTRLGQKQIERLISGAAQKGIVAGAVNQINVSLPPRQVQSQIAEEIKRRRKEAERFRSQAEKVVKEAKEKAERMILGNRA